MRPLLLIALVCLLSVLLLPSGLPTTRAQQLIEPDWCYTFDFTDPAGQQGWAPMALSADIAAGWSGGAAVFYSGAGWGLATDNWGAYWSGGTIGIQQAFEASITGIQYQPETSDIGIRIFWRNSMTNPAYAQPPHVEWTGTAGNTYYFATPFEVTTGLQVGLSKNFSFSTAYRMTQLYLEGVGTNPFPTNECGDDGLIRPFSLADENPAWGLRDFDVPGFSFSVLQLGAMIQGNYDIVAGSLSENDYVLAPASGQVLTVEPIEDIDCGLLTIIWADKCIFLRPKEPSDPLVYTGGIEAFVFDTRQDIYKVGVLTDEGYLLQYIVADADSYVHPGLLIDPNCILGRAVPISGLVEAVPVLSALVGAVSGFNVEVLAGEPVGNPGVTIIRWLNPGKGLGLFTEYGNPDEACNGDQDLATCLTFNPKLQQDGDGWDPIGQVTWLPDGALVTPGATIGQSLNLADTNYTVIASVNPVFSGDNNHQFLLQLGTLTQTFQIDSSGIGGTTYQLTGDPEPDYGGVGYTVRLTNTGTSNLIVKYICVEAGAANEPTTCTFTNPTFESDLSGWTPSDASVVWRQGSAYIPIGQNITQGAALPPGSYVLEFDVRIAFDPLTYTGGGAVSVNVYRPDGASGNSPLDINWNQIGQPGYPNIPQRITITFTQIAPAGNFVRFEPVLDTPATGITGIFLDRACVYLTSQGPGDGGGQCARPSAPISSEVGAWTAWHWANLNRFFTCDLMILLTQQYNFIQTSTNTILMSIRWFMASITYTSNWAGTDLFPWLGGHFRNMAVGQVTMVNQESNAGFWDVLIAIIESIIQPILDLILWIIGEAARLLLWVIQALLSLILQVISLLLNIILLGMQVLTSLISAFNAAPIAPISNLPQCGLNPQSHGFCVALWILENTIFSGPGALMIPLIVAISSIHLLIWVLAEYQRVIRRIGMLS